MGVLILTIAKLAQRVCVGGGQTRRKPSVLFIYYTYVTYAYYMG